MSHTFYMLAVVSLVTVLAATQAQAGKVHPVENFTRSISSLYVILKQCSAIAYNGNKPEIDSIKKYMGKLYPGGIPYWALPHVKSQITDENMCSYFTYEKSIAYRQARADFQKHYPRQPAPPRFIVSQPANYYQMSRFIFDNQRERLDFDW